VLSRFCAEVATELTQPAPPQDAAAAPPPGTQAAAPVVPSIQVVMVDFTGRKQIAASPELPAPQSASPEVPESPEDHP
jgi:hypothetical protein